MTLDECKIQILEYLKYTDGQKNDLTYEVFSSLNELKDSILNSNLDIESKVKMITTIGISNGCLIYNTKEMSSEIGVTRTNLKLSIQELIESKSISVTKENIVDGKNTIGITMLKLN